MGQLTIELTDDNFQQEVLESGKLSLVDFWADWCGPCRMIAPIIDEIAEEFAGQAVVGKVDIDKCDKLVAAHKIMRVPTFMIIKGEEVLEKVSGMRPKEEIAKMLRKHL